MDDKTHDRRQSETPAAPVLRKEECWFQMLLRLTQQEVKTQTSHLNANLMTHLEA